VKVDVANAEDVEAMIETAESTHVTINGNFNNAGIGLVKPFLEMDLASYHRVVEVDHMACIMECPMQRRRQSSQ
jgi:NAD(P)-dependent dehydrogenase (short-subunit alcohol dehydrogenase family)